MIKLNTSSTVNKEMDVKFEVSSFEGTKKIKMLIESFLLFIPIFSQYFNGT